MTDDTQTYRAFAEVYDCASVSLAEATWREGIIKALSAYITAGRTVLDLGCGTGIGGRLMQGLGLERIVGLDRSPAMLRTATPYYAKTMRRDIESLATDLGLFDFVVSGGDTLNYLNRSKLSTALKTCGQILRGDESRLIFDYSSPVMLQEYWRNLSYDQALSKTRKLQWSHVFDNATHATTTEITLFENEIARWTEFHIQYTMTATEMACLAEHAGLAIESVRDVPGDRFSSRAHTHLYVIRKK